MMTRYTVWPRLRKINLAVYLRRRMLKPKGFPTHFPTGENTLNSERSIKLSRSKYFNACRLSADGRFASDPQYIFYSQYTTELEQLTSSISIRMRQGTARGRDGRKITANMLNESNELDKLLRNELLLYATNQRFSSVLG